jgi:hypothetical protein
VLIVIVAVLARNRPGNRLGRVIVDYVTAINNRIRRLATRLTALQTLANTS